MSRMDPNNSHRALDVVVESSQQKRLVLRKKGVNTFLQFINQASDSIKDRSQRNTSSQIRQFFFQFNAMFMVNIHKLESQ